MFRRRNDAAPAVLDAEQPQDAPAQPARQAGKGRPTPKRSEVERRRREPHAPPPADRKAAAAQRRERQATDRKRRMDAMRRGEEWAMRPVDKGPVKALARDYIDSRRMIVSEYVLFLVFVIIIGVFFLGRSSKSGGSGSYLILLIELGIVALIALESLYLSLRVSRLVRQRLPGASTRGLTWYIAKRAIKLRSSRIPPARVQRGQEI